MDYFYDGLMHFLELQTLKLGRARILYNSDCFGLNEESHIHLGWPMAINYGIRYHLGVNYSFKSKLKKKRRDPCSFVDKRFSLQVWEYGQHMFVP